MSTTPVSSLTAMQRVSAIALMAAMIAAGALFHMAIGPVPVTFQDFFVVLTGFVLGPRYGVYAVGLYLLAGAIGLPVFSGARGGIGHFFGPTGGYLIGFAVLAFFAGLAKTTALNMVRQKIRQQDQSALGIQARSKETLLFMAVALPITLVGLAFLYGLGTGWLAWRLETSFAAAFAIGVVPFLPFGIPKVVLAIILGYRLTHRRALFNPTNPSRS